MPNYIRLKMGGSETDMKKNNIGAIIILIMTIGLVGLVAYFSFLLNNKDKPSITQIKKTKASAQTYHKLLALNSATSESSDQSSSVTDSGDEQSSSSLSSVVSSTVSPAAANVSPATTPPLLALNKTTPTVIPSPTSRPTAIPTPTIPVKILTSPSPTAIPRTTKVPTPTTALLIYRTITTSPSPFPTKMTGSKVIVSPTTKIIPTQAVLASDKLPETGWVQLSTILFIVAATTVFISFLF